MQYSLSGPIHVSPTEAVLTGIESVSITVCLISGIMTGKMRQSYSIGQHLSISASADKADFNQCQVNLTNAMQEGVQAETID